MGRIHRLAASSLVLLVAAWAAAGSAAAADQPIAGKKLVIKRSGAGIEKLVFVSKDTSYLFPAIGGADDPATGTPGGAVVELFSQNDPGGGSLSVPAGLGKPGWRVKDGSVDLYKFINSLAPGGISPVRVLVVKQGRVLKISAKSTGLALAGSQGSVGIRVSFGSLRSCAFFGPTTVRRDEPNRFLARNALAGAVPDCSDASLSGAGGGSTSTSTTIVGATTTTSTLGTSTTSTSLPPGAQLLDFTTTIGSGPCGETRTGASAHIVDLACGGLNLGGGEATVHEGLIPDGSTSRFLVTNCVGDDCDLAATQGAGGGIDCTDTGCSFGPPLEIPNGGLTTCIVNRFASAGGGTVDLAAGDLSLAVPLASQIFVTGNNGQPCPRCSASGAPGNPGQGTCDRGANNGGSCQSTNSLGLTTDCLPGGGDGSQDLGSIGVDLTPLVTDTVTTTSATGLFCPGQTAGGREGCFGESSCRTIEENGLMAGTLVPNTPLPAVMASTFCIPKTGNILVDGAADLPGPGAASLPGTVTLVEIIGTTTTSTSSTIVTSTSNTVSTTTSTSSTSTTSTTLLPPLLPLTVEFASTGGGGVCGATRNGIGTVIQDLDCGDLALGGGTATLPPATLPDGAVNHFALGGCGLLLSCALEATSVAGANFDCTDTGCFFGPPVPIPNGALSACSVSTFSAPATGTVNLLTGATTANVALDLHLYVTGSAAQPCPLCSAPGTPAAPGSGTCDRGANAGGACTSLNSLGLSKDCQPGGLDGSADLGSLLANLAPVTTGTATLSNPTGFFCPGQANAGCFGNSACRSIQETGVAPSSLLSAVNPQPATLVSTFCIPKTGNLLIDGSVDLPGPAAISLPGLVRSSL
jgi:hypothetical protein